MPLSADVDPEALISRRGGLTDVIGCVLAEGMRTSLGGLADQGTETGLPFDEVAQVLHRSARCHNCTD